MSAAYIGRNQALGTPPRSHSSNPAAGRLHEGASATYAAAREYRVGGLMTTLKTIAGACVFASLATTPAAARTRRRPIGRRSASRTPQDHDAAEGEASKNNSAIVITIIDSGGNIVMLHRRNDVSYHRSRSPRARRRPRSVQAAHRRRSTTPSPAAGPACASWRSRTSCRWKAASLS